MGDHTQKLDYIEPEPQRNEKDDIIDGRDAVYKQKMKQQREGRKTKEINLLLGDYVLVKQPRQNKWRTPYEPVFYVVCSIRGSQITARCVTDGRIVCRDPSRFKLVNAVINTIDEPEKSVEAQIQQAVPDLQIPGKRTPPSVSPVPTVPPDTVANAERPQEPPNVEIIPEQGTELVQGAEHNRPVNRLAVTRPRRERRQPSYLKDYMLA